MYAGAVLRSVAVLSSLAALAGCDRKSDDPAGAAPGPAAAGTSGRCPEGRWAIASARPHAEQDLARSGARGSRVPEAAGNAEYTFTATGPEAGSYRMDAAGGKTLRLTMESNLGSAVQQTTVNVTGTVEGTYRKVAADRLALSDPTTTDVAAKATVTIARRTIELPAFDVPADAWRGVLRATCTAEGMTLVAEEGATFYRKVRLVRR